MLEAFADDNVQRPGLAEVLKGRDDAVVVPVLLSSGYHVRVDVGETVNRAGSRVRATRPLGPDPALARVLAERLAEAGAEDHAIVLAAAGSSDDRSARDVEEAARMLADRVGRPVTAAYATAAEPSVAEAVTGLQAEGRRVAVAAYLLAPGHFYERLRTVGADIVTAPLLPHPALADLVLQRYDEAIRAG